MRGPGGEADEGVVANGATVGLEAAHFEAWLELWRRHCRAHIGGAEAEELISAAESVGARIRWVIERHGPNADSQA